LGQIKDLTEVEIMQSWILKLVGKN